MKQDIEHRFAANLARVTGLVRAYERTAPGLSGRRRVTDTDLLRAAVVLLHATLEDLIRSLMEWRLPTAAPSSLKDVKLVGLQGQKFTLEDVAHHRGKTVDQLIAESVSLFLERSNYNNTTDIAAALNSVTLVAAMDAFGPALDPMMQRRHWIVHRADRNTIKSGSGHYATRSLDQASVEQWVAAVDAFGKRVLEQC